MSRQLHLTDDGQLAIRAAEALCWRTNTAILGPEHLLAGALLVLGEAGWPGLPDASLVRRGLATAQGVGDEPLRDDVVWGSSARAALEKAAESLREAGVETVGAREIALALVESGEVNPIFYAAITATREQLGSSLASRGGRPEDDGGKEPQGEHPPPA